MFLRQFETGKTQTRCSSNQRRFSQSKEEIVRRWKGISTTFHRVQRGMNQTSPFLFSVTLSTWHRWSNKTIHSLYSLSQTPADTQAKCLYLILVYNTMSCHNVRFRTPPKQFDRFLLGNCHKQPLPSFTVAQLFNPKNNLYDKWVLQLVSFDYQKRERAASNSEVSKTVIQEQKRKIDDILKLVEKLKEYEQILMEEIRKHLIYEVRFAIYMNYLKFHNFSKVLYS